METLRDKNLHAVTVPWAWLCRDLERDCAVTLSVTVTITINITMTFIMSVCANVTVADAVIETVTDTDTVKVILPRQYRDRNTEAMKWFFMVFI